MNGLFYCPEQERAARRLLINEKLETVDNVAAMTAGDVAEKIQKHYEVIYKMGNEILLIKKEDMATFKSIAVKLLNEDLIVGAGAKVGSAVNSKTDFLVIADVNSQYSKAKKARELGTKLISPEELEEMLP